LIRKVLLPIDGSDNALRAVDFVIGLVRENGPIAVHLITAHEEPIVYGEVQIHMTQDRAAALMQDHSKKLLQPALEKFAAAGIAVTSEIRVGHLAQEICAAATDQDCDAIVMGTRGMGAVGNLLMGSVATKVIHLATMPVILVK